VSGFDQSVVRVAALHHHQAVVGIRYVPVYEVGRGDPAARVARFKGDECAELHQACELGTVWLRAYS